MQIKEGKQAEFLLFNAFPWALVEKIGVIDRQVDEEVHASLASASYEPPVQVERRWYY